MFEDIIKPDKIEKFKMPIIKELCMGDIYKCTRFTSKYDYKKGTWDHDECHFRKLSGGVINECLKKSPA
ncbi:hypothetical protein KAR91_08660 [Candidatus Pacearchaeota archaeon]|nr:hypothetical protein [Candidatus Pacearchaeota archaeon]